MTRSTRLLLALPLLLLLACPGGGDGDGGGGDGGADGGADAGPADRDQDGILDADDGCPDEAEDVDGVEDTDGCPDPGDDQGTLPPPPPASAGVAYSAHFLSPDLAIVRVDSGEPVLETRFDLGDWTHDLTLDPYADLLFSAHDVSDQVQIHALARPPDSVSRLEPPVRAAAIRFDDSPRFVRVNPHRKRLYVVVTPADTQPGDPYELHAYDYSDPASPSPVDGSPFSIPSTSSLDLDPVRDLLFVFHGVDDTLHVFDLGGDGFRPLDGGARLLTSDYPQENQFGFQARRLTVDPVRARLYAGRPQGGLSELIAYQYPALIPRDGARYGQFAHMREFEVVRDAFDVDVPLDERPDILGAYRPVVDSLNGVVFLSAEAWNGQSTSATVAAFFAEDLTLGPGCEDHDGFGCFYQTFSAGAPTGYQRTDGAACAFADRGIFVGTALDAFNEEDPGQLHLFTYDEQLGMRPLLPADGGGLRAGALPIGVECH